MIDKNTNKPISLTAARLSLLTAAAFLVLFALLHVIKPEIDPSWRFISEYELGRYGWVMVIAFLCLAVSCVSLFIAIRSQVQNISGRIGLFLLLVGAVGMTMAAVFTTDPITAGKDALTTHGQIHGTGALLGGGVIYAALFIAWSLVRRNQAWVSVRGLLLAGTALALIGEIVMDVSMAVMFPHDGNFGPDVLIGWPSRFYMVALSGWLITVAWCAIKIQKRNTS